MSSAKNIILFVNDSYFSYLLSKDLIEKYHDHIELIVFSKSTINSTRKIYDIYKKVSFNYFVYRTFIQVLSKTVYRNKSVKYLSGKFNIKHCTVTKASQLKEKIAPDFTSVGFAFNFDSIIRKDVLSKFEMGIYNIHASKLPEDKGISPVLWAFARGDEKIWSTIYKMDEGIDSGPIARQFETEVKSDDTSYSIYRSVCMKSGFILSSMVNEIMNGEIILHDQTPASGSNYFSWPDYAFHRMMRKSHRKLISVKDIANLAKRSHSLSRYFNGKRSE